MRKLLIYLFSIAYIFILGTTIVRCEKDDICETEIKKTPLLFISFFDSQNRQNPKNVNNLRIIATDFLDTPDHVPLLFNGVSEIKIPLKTNIDQTEYLFYLNAENDNVSLRNTDRIVINYARKDVYISRACGFKTHFDLNFANPFEVSEPAENSEAYPSGSALWISSVSIINTEITQDEAPHIFIYF